MRVTVCTYRARYSGSFDLCPSFKVPQNITDISNFTNLRKVHFLDIFTNPDTTCDSGEVRVQMPSRIACHSVQEMIFEFRKPDGIIVDWTCIAMHWRIRNSGVCREFMVQTNVYSNREDMILSERDALQVAERLIRQGSLSAFNRREPLQFTLFKYKKGFKAR